MAQAVIGLGNPGPEYRDTRHNVGQRVVDVLAARLATSFAPWPAGGSAHQLATARRMMEKAGVSFPLVEAPGEAVPLPDASFDLAVSEFGASLWADPAMWVPEAARLLRPRGSRCSRG